MNTTVSWVGLALSLFLVAVAAAISWWQRLGWSARSWSPLLARWPSCCWSAPPSP